MAQEKSVTLMDSWQSCVALVSTQEPLPLGFEGKVWPVSPGPLCDSTCLQGTRDLGTKIGSSSSELPLKNFALRKAEPSYPTVLGMLGHAPGALGERS